MGIVRSDSTAALTTKGVIVSFCPCRATKSACTCLRVCVMFVQSIS